MPAPPRDGPRARRKLRRAVREFARLAVLSAAQARLFERDVLGAFDDALRAGAAPADVKLLAESLSEGHVRFEVVAGGPGAGTLH